MLTAQQKRFLHGFAEALLTLNFNGVMNNLVENAQVNTAYENTPAGRKDTMDVFDDIIEAGDMQTLQEVLAVPFNPSQLPAEYKQVVDQVLNSPAMMHQKSAFGDWINNLVGNGNGNSPDSGDQTETTTNGGGGFDWNALVNGVLTLVGIGMANNNDPNNVPVEQPAPVADAPEEKPFPWKTVGIVAGIVLVVGAIIGVGVWAYRKYGKK